MDNSLKLLKMQDLKDQMRSFIKLVLPKKFRTILCRATKRICFLGYRYTCPFCKSSLRALLPSGLNFPVLKQKEIIGGGYRQNSVCPVCGSNDRERLLYLYVSNRTNVFKKSLKLLHVSPEPRMRDVLQNRKDIDYLTADINPKGVMIQMDITHIQFPENFFDFIICNHVLEHVIDDGKAMRELYRVLKPGGEAILQVPISLALDNTFEDFSITTVAGRQEAFGQGDHVRIYARDYKVRLEQAGFIVDVFQWASEGVSFYSRINKFALNEKEAIYFVRKSC